MKTKSKCIYKLLLPSAFSIIFSFSSLEVTMIPLLSRTELKAILLPEIQYNGFPVLRPRLDAMYQLKSNPLNIVPY